jgi:diguanylate cyclase (GGDEF)-like protein
MQTGGWVSTHEDITHRMRLEERIAHLAMHDDLTDLPNRVLLRERFQQALAARQGQESTAVLYLDLDRFKQVNDTFGHAVGDALLKSVSDRINSCVRKTDTVARIGGDEFIVVQSSADPDEEAATLAERLIKRVSLPYVLGESTVEIGVSIGIAVAPRDGADQDQLMHNADLALYRSKAQGRGTYHFFERSMQDRAKAASRADTTDGQRVRMTGSLRFAGDH